VADQRGNVVGAVEVFNKGAQGEEGCFVAEDAEAVLGLEQYMVTVVRVIKLVKAMEEMSWTEKEGKAMRSMCRAIMRRCLVSLCTTTLRAENGAIWMADRERQAATVIVTAGSDEGANSGEGSKVVRLEEEDTEVGHVIANGTILVLPSFDQEPSELYVPLHDTVRKNMRSPLPFSFSFSLPWCHDKPPPPPHLLTFAAYTTR